MAVPGARRIDDAEATAAAMLSAFAAERRSGRDTLVIRAAGRPNLIARLAAPAETQPVIRMGCASCDVLGPAKVLASTEDPR